MEIIEALQERIQEGSNGGLGGEGNHYTLQCIMTSQMVTEVVPAFDSKSSSGLAASHWPIHLIGPYHPITRHLTIDTTSYNIGCLSKDLEHAI